MSKYKVDSGSLTAVADAIRAKTGNDEPLEFPNEFVSEIASINGGGIQTGTFTVASDIAVTTSGVSITVGFSGHPDTVYCWMDADTFNDLGTYVNNKWYRWFITKKDATLFSTFPPLRINNSTIAQTTFANVSYILSVAGNVNSNTDPNCSPGYTANAFGAYSPYNVAVNSINSNGTLTLARFSTAGSTIPAGTYHYLAITGASIIMP